MRLHVINPNTSTAMSEKIAIAAERASRQAQIVTLTSRHGPASLESHFDEALAVPGLLEQVDLIQREGGSDGILVACFGDPGVLAARELADVPVFGIAEAAMRTAAALGTRFSVVTTLGRTLPIIERVVRESGLERACSRLRACEIPVASLEDTDDGSRGRLLDECRRALDEDGIDTLVLGCAGMADLTDWISAELRVPVIDGVAAGVQLLEGLAHLGLRPAKRFDRTAPPAKPIQGAFAALARR
ncbi:aspartate/glutamate racemase family protein [Halotalea alkalilenta]|uniref:Asp/Glu/hydantoin racemase n=1 Tax=Halotalea alkalilenta TaxID=376489 RepID=A0A172YG19_9GAMM|nr:aspartate/glutamate racemase family protein [Halotalea alkalilenta]ANF58012.1 hypothetical protein A5892_11515 [Halotalea alkalilenta]